MKPFPLRALKVSLDIESKGLEDRLRQHHRRQSEIEKELDQSKVEAAAADAEMQRVMGWPDQAFNILVLECASEWVQIAADKVEASDELLREQLIEVDHCVVDLNRVRGQLSVVERKHEAWKKEVDAIALKASEREIDEIFSSRKLAW